MQEGGASLCIWLHTCSEHKDPEKVVQVDWQAQKAEASVLKRGWLSPSRTSTVSPSRAICARADTASLALPVSPNILIFLVVSALTFASLLLAAGAWPN